MRAAVAAEPVRMTPQNLSCSNPREFTIWHRECHRTDSRREILCRPGRRIALPRQYFSAYQERRRNLPAFPLIFEALRHLVRALAQVHFSEIEIKSQSIPTGQNQVPPLPEELDIKANRSDRLDAMDDRRFDDACVAVRRQD